MCQANRQGRILTLLAQQARREPAGITAAMHLYDDLQFDSLDMADIALQLEDTFGIEITNEQEASLLTVGDIFKIVGELQA